MLTQRFNVFDDPGRFVVLPLAMGTRASATALVEQDDFEVLQVKKRQVIVAGTTARPAVQEEHRFTTFLAVPLPIHLMAAGYRQVPTAIQRLHAEGRLSK